MKRRLNIFCVLMFMVLGYSLYMSFYQFGSGVITGVDLAEWEKAKLKENKKSLFQSDFRMVDVIPLAAMWHPDSVLNAKTGEQVPAMYSQLVVRVHKDMNYANVIVNLISSLTNILVLVTAVVMFILLILNINRSRIFEWKNVRLLRWLGVLFTLSFVCELLPQMMNYSGLKELFALNNYMISPLEVKVTNLLLGISCLIVAEIFAIGLRLKEEQDLTI